MLRQRRSLFFSSLSLFTLVLQDLCQLRKTTNLNFRNNIILVKQALGFLGRLMRGLAHPCSLQIFYVEVEFVKFHPLRECNYLFIRILISSSCKV